MAGLLLDTHALIWFVAEAPIEDTALFAIADAQQARRLFVSPITAWEAALAVRKGNPQRRPDLAGDDAASWFRRAMHVTGARLAPVTPAVALEAARVPSVYGSKDPGDGFIIATARVRKLIVVSRDGLMTDLADNRPDYLWLIRC